MTTARKTSSTRQPSSGIAVFTPDSAPRSPLEAYRARCLALLRERGYHGTGPARFHLATFDQAGQLVALAVKVASASVADLAHIATWQAGGRASCDCQAGQYSRACWHAGAAIAAADYLSRRARLGWPED